MSLRPLLAGPSACSIPLRTIARQLTVSRPDVVPGDGQTNRFLIKSNARLESMAHIFAVVRAAEKALGSSVISVNVRRDADTNQAYRFIHIETLQPIDHSKPIVCQAVAPKLTSDMYGGPSLAEVREALRPTTSDPTDPDDSMIDFRIEKEPRNPRNAPVNTTKAWSQNVALLDRLEEMGGSWEEIAKKWTWLRDETKPTSRQDQRQGQRLTRFSDGDASALAIRVEKDEAQSERRDSKHRKHEDQGRSRRRTDNNDPLGTSRRRSDRVREDRHRRREDRVDRDETEEPVADWSFKPVTAADKGLVLVDDEITAPPPDRKFSIRSELPPRPERQDQAESETVESTEAAEPVPAAQPARKTAVDKKAKAETPEQTAAREAQTKRIQEQMRRDAEAKALRDQVAAPRAKSNKDKGAKAKEQQPKANVQQSKDQAQQPKAKAKEQEEKVVPSTSEKKEAASKPAQSQDGKDGAEEPKKKGWFGGLF